MPGIPVTTSAAGTDLVVADLNVDGLPDLLVPLLGGKLGVLYNRSASSVISFDNTSPAPTSQTQLTGVQVGDLDNDGYPDLFMLNSNGVLEVKLQHTLGTFDTLCSFPGQHAQHILVDEVNSSDSTLDILLSSDNLCEVNALYFMPSTLDTYHADGKPAVLPVTGQPIVGQINAAQLIDLDRSGLNDVVLTDALNHELQIYTHIDLPLGSQVVDPDTGEMIDPVPGVFYGYQAASYSYATCPLPSLGVTGQYQAAPKQIYQGDIDNNGYLDVAVTCDYQGPIPSQPWWTTPALTNANVPWTMVWLLRSSVVGSTPTDVSWMTDPTAFRKAMLTVETGLTFPNIINDVKLADLDNDGKIDVVGCCDGPGVGGWAFFVYPGLGNFTFGPPVEYFVPAPPLRIATTDFDRDGLVDVAVLMPTAGAVSVFRNTGSSGLGLVSQPLAFLSNGT
jgi:hypothetical protein